jgi:hypothetical protein
MNQQVMQQPAPLSPAASQMIAELDLLPGEVIHYSIQGDGFFMGSNPLAKAAAAIQSFVVTITGGHIRVFVVITSQRVLLLQSMQTFCGMSRVRAINAIALASLMEAGSGKDTQWCCIHTRSVHLETKTQRHNLVIKKLDDRALRDFVRNLSAVMVANVHGRTAT